MKKLLNKKGFTLMEMLIVVAIIVILVAVAVPTFSGSLNEAKSATDEANLRAAKAAAASAYMVDQIKNTETVKNGSIYNLETGAFDGAETLDYGEVKENKHIKITISSGGIVDAEWVKDAN